MKKYLMICLIFTFCGIPSPRNYMKCKEKVDKRMKEGIALGLILTQAKYNDINTFIIGTNLYERDINLEICKNAAKEGRPDGL